MEEMQLHYDYLKLGKYSWVFILAACVWSASRTRRGKPWLKSAIVLSVALGALVTGWACYVFTDALAPYQTLSAAEWAKFMLVFLFVTVQPMFGSWVGAMVGKARRHSTAAKPSS